MADLTIEGVRQQYPQYGDLSDGQLAQALHKKYYSDMPFDTFAGKIGYAQPPAPKDYDPTPKGGVPEGFHEIRTNGAPYIVHDTTIDDAIKALSDLPGVGAAERIGQGATRLAGKAASGIAGIFGGPDTVQKVQGAVNNATELPLSNDPVVQANNALGQGAAAVAAPVDRAVGNLPPGPRTAVEGVEEAIPDISNVLGMRAAVPMEAATPQIARSPADVAQAAGYTGLRTKADLNAPGNKAITNTLISQDAGIVPGQIPSVAALENALKVGPGKVYAQAENDIPPQLSFKGPGGAELQDRLGNLPNTVSDLPRSPDVDALQETMLSKPEFTRDTLFANIREARQRAKAAWKNDDPDKNALGDAYANLANAYEDFAGAQLEANPNASVTLGDWKAARTQFAKNYQAQGALRGEDFDPQVYARTAARNPHLLTGNGAVVGHIANGLPSSAPVGMADILPEAAGVTAGGAAAELLGNHLGIPGGATAGGIAGHYAAAPLIRAKLQELLRRGNPELAGQTSTNPALSYFFNQGRMPSGWNRSPAVQQIAGLLPSPSMVNAGGGASTLNTLENLGLTPDVQAAGVQHPAAARLSALREQLSQPPERPAESLDFQGPQKWGDFSIAPPGESSQPQSSPVSAPFADVLEQGGTQGKPIAGIKSGYRPAPQSPKGPNMRTPEGAPELTSKFPTGPSDAQIAFRNRQAAARLRKVAGDLSMQGPGGSSGSPIDRLRDALQRQERGYAEGGRVDPLDFTGRYNTALTPEQEQQFQVWAKSLGKQGSSYDYDMRGAWLNGAGQAANGHFPDTYKKPNHPTFSDQSQYSGMDGYQGGQWQQGAQGKWLFIPSDSNLKMHSPEELTQYFKRVEPTNQLVLPPMDQDEEETYASGGEIMNFVRRRYVDGGAVRGSSSPGSPGVGGAVQDALAALRDYFVTRPRRELQAEREQFENSTIDNPPAAPPGPPTSYGDGGPVPDTSVHPKQSLADALARLAAVPSAGADPAAQAAYLARARTQVGDQTASLMRLRAILNAAQPSASAPTAVQGGG